MNPEQVRTLYEQGHSLATIARQLQSHPATVGRLLKKLGVRLRSRSEAQKKALADGRHPHPTRGRSLSAETRRRISQSVARAWEKTSASQRGLRSQAAGEAWQARSEGQRQRLQRLAQQGVRQAAESGSKLERYLLAGLRSQGYRVLRTDGLFLPDWNVLVLVHGAAHFLPLWGEEVLARKQEIDQTRRRELADQGILVILVKNLLPHDSLARYQNCLTKLFSTLSSTLSEDVVIEV